ncbi:MAG: hypothetical protein ABGZ23_30010 [Fuerstiella sp.]|nr:hypothetical protein [Fuerstiella sp.]
MSNLEPETDTAAVTTNPYAVAEGVGKERQKTLSWLQKAIVGGLSGSISLLVLTLLLTVVGLAVTFLYETRYYSRETTHLIITALLIGGITLSLGISVLAGSRSFRKLQQIIRTLSGPTAARVKLEQQVAAILRDRSPP